MDKRGRNLISQRSIRARRRLIEKNRKRDRAIAEMDWPLLATFSAATTAEERRAVIKASLEIWRRP